MNYRVKHRPDPPPSLSQVQRVNPSQIHITQIVSSNPICTVGSATWNNTTVAIKQRATFELPDIQNHAVSHSQLPHELHILHQLQPHPYIIQPVGWYHGTPAVPPALAAAWPPAGPAAPPGLLLQWAAHGTLDTWIRTAAPRQRYAMVLTIAQQLASVLAHAHANGIIHRVRGHSRTPGSSRHCGVPSPLLPRTHPLLQDIKPANILLEQADPVHIRVADWGIARRLESPAAVWHTFHGTPLYAAPELLAGKLHGTPGDVWAWGAVMFTCCTGWPARAPPVHLSSQAKYAAMHSPHQVLPSDLIDASLVRLICLALAPEPELRPTSQQLLDAMRASSPPAQHSPVQELSEAGAQPGSARSVVASPSEAHACSSARRAAPRQSAPSRQRQSPSRPALRSPSHSPVRVRVGRRHRAQRQHAVEQARAPSPETPGTEPEDSPDAHPLPVQLFSPSPPAVAAVAAAFGKPAPRRSASPRRRVLSPRVMKLRGTPGPSPTLPKSPTVPKPCSPVAISISPAISVQPVSPPQPDPPAAARHPSPPRTPTGPPKPGPVPAALPVPAEETAIAPGTSKLPPLNARARAKLRRAATAAQRTCAVHDVAHVLGYIVLCVHRCIADVDEPDSVLEALREIAASGAWQAAALQPIAELASDPRGTWLAVLDAVQYMRALGMRGEAEGREVCCAVQAIRQAAPAGRSAWSALQATGAARMAAQASESRAVQYALAAVAGAVSPCTDEADAAAQALCSWADELCSGAAPPSPAASHELAAASPAPAAPRSPAGRARAAARGAMQFPVFNVVQQTWHVRQG